MTSIRSSSRDAETIALQTLKPASERLYRQYIVASLVLAVSVGFLLAIHVPLARLFDLGRPERTADLIRAHGQAQLLGFAGLYVIGLSFRLLPRFTGARLGFESLAQPVLWVLGSALILKALLVPWFDGDFRLSLLFISSFGVLIASAAFVLVLAATLALEARRPDASGLAFVLGAGSLFAASLISTLTLIAAVEDGGEAPPYLAENAILQIEMFGFLLVFITGVGLRALPILVGIQRPLAGARLIPLGLALAAALLAGSLLTAEYLSSDPAVLRLVCSAVVLIGFVLLGFIWLAGVLRPVSNRVRPASQPHLWLLRTAFTWLTFAALLLVFVGLRGVEQGRLPSQLDFDAVRHAVGLGVITPLILGMSLMILPEFAAQRQGRNRQRELALALASLLNLAVLLRVLPALIGTGWSFDQRNLSIALAGSLGEIAILIFSTVVLRLVWNTRHSLGGV